MKNETRYQTAAGLRMALEERLNHQAREEGTDVQRLRRHVAFDRFLVRVFSAPGDRFVLKGGYAFELWLERARATKDIDLSFRDDLSGKRKKSKAVDAAKMQEQIQQLVSVNSRDFFEFVIGQAVLDLENAPYGGWRFPVEVRMAGYVFIRFAIDVAVGDLWLEPHDLLQTLTGLASQALRRPKFQSFPGSSSSLKNCTPIPVPGRHPTRGSRTWSTC